METVEPFQNIVLFLRFLLRTRLYHIPYNNANIFREKFHNFAKNFLDWKLFPVFSHYAVSDRLIFDKNVKNNKNENAYRPS